MIIAIGVHIMGVDHTVVSWTDWALNVNKWQNKMTVQSFVSASECA